MVLVLGTTILIDALRSNRAALRKVAEIVAEEEIVCTTEVNVLGRLKSQWPSLITKAQGKFMQYVTHTIWRRASNIHPGRSEGSRRGGGTSVMILWPFFGIYVELFFPSISHSYPARYMRPDPSSSQPPQ